MSMKRTLSLVLALAMVFSLMSPGVAYANTEEGEGHVHAAVIHYAANDATCEADGNIDYWQCECGAYFADASCTAELVDGAWVIPATGHSYDEATGVCTCGAADPEFLASAGGSAESGDEGEQGEEPAQTVQPALRGARGLGGGTIVTAVRRVAAMVYYEDGGYEDSFTALQDAVQAAGAAYYNPADPAELWGNLLPEVTMAQNGELSGNVVLKTEITLNLNSMTLDLTGLTSVTGGSLSLVGPGTVTGYDSELENLEIANGSYYLNGQVKKGYLITYVSDEEVVHVEEIAEGTATAPAVSKPNYTLVSWNSNGSAWNFSNNVGSSMTLTAQWTPTEYHITYNTDGGALPAGAENPETYTVETAALALPSPTKATGVFAGWYKDAACNLPFTYEMGTTTGDFPLYADWTAAVANVGGVGYATLAEAFAAAQDGDTVTLVDNYTIPGDKLVLDLDDRNVTLDLNDKTLTGRTNLTSGHLTVTNGAIECLNGQALNVYGSGDASASDFVSLNVTNSVSITADYAVCVFGPTASSTGSYGASVIFNGTATCVKGAIFVSGNIGNNGAMSVDTANMPQIEIGPNANITSSDQALAMNGMATVTVAGGAALTGREAIGLKRGVLVVNGGSFTATGAKVDDPQVNNNGTEATGAALSITGTYNYAGAIQATVNGGSFTSTNGSALFVGHSSNSSGAVAYENGVELEISGGSFTAAAGEPALFVATAAETGEPLPAGFVSGGTFSSAVPEAYAAEGFLPVENANGTYGVTPSYVVSFNTNGGSEAPASVTVPDTGTATVARPADPTKADGVFAGWYTHSTAGTLWHFTGETDPNPVTSTMTLHAHWTPAVASVNGQGYATLAEAIASIAAGETATVTLLEDHAIDASGYAFYHSGASRTITVDLGTHTLSVPGDPIDIVSDNVTFTNGTISGGDYAFYVINNPTAGACSLTIASNARITQNDGYAIVVSGSTQNYASTVNMNGTINGGCIFVHGNVGSTINAVVNINGTIYNPSDVAVAQNGYSTVNVGESARITGVTGIEVRAGVLNVASGAVITGTGTPTEVNPNGSGTTTTGAGVAIAQHTTKLPITVNISGGTISGHSALYESNPESNEDAAIGQISMSVTGGTFTGTNAQGTALYVADAAIIGGFIANPASGDGPRFSSPVPEAYAADGFIPGEYDETTNRYGVKTGTYVAHVSGQGYETFAAAVTAANGTETITLDADIADAYTMTAGETLKVKKGTFDLTVNAPAGYSLLTSVSDGVTTYTLEEITYDVWVGGTQITATKASDLFEDGTVSFDAETNTLTLNGYTYSGVGYNSAAVCVGDVGGEDFHIVVVGENSLTSTATYGYAIRSTQTGKVTVTGSGDNPTLNLTVPSAYNTGYAVSVKGTQATFKDLTMNVTGYLGLVVNGNNAAGDTLNIENCAITFSGTAIDQAIWVYNESGDGVVNITESSLTGKGAILVYGYGTAGGDALLNITDSTVTLSGCTAESSRHALEVLSKVGDSILTIDNSAVTVTASNGLNPNGNGPDGINVGSQDSVNGKGLAKIEIKNNSVVIATGNANGVNLFTWGGDTVNAYGAQLIVSDSTLTATATDTTGGCYGITAYAYKHGNTQVTFTNSNVTASAPATAGISLGAGENYNSEVGSLTLTSTNSTVETSGPYGLIVSTETTAGNNTTPTQTVTITDGSFTSNGPIYVLGDGSDSASITMAGDVVINMPEGSTEAPITTDTLNIASGTYTITGADGDDILADGNITGGYFTTNVAAYCADGYGVFPNTDDNSATYPYKVLPTTDAVACINDTTYYATLASAIAAAADGDTVTLLANVTLGATLTISKSLTLDLGGKTLTGRVTIDNGTVTVQNGTIAGRFDAYDSATVTLAASATVNGIVVVWGDGTYGEAGCKTPTLNVYGTINSIGYQAISTNGTDKSGANINIYDGAVVESTDDLGIYLPSGNLTISGGTVTGTTAVYIKSGTLSITGGTLNGTGAAAAFSHDGNGANATGDALVVENTNYPGGAPSVNITAGMFTSTNGKGIGSYADVDNGVTELASVTASSNGISISGGLIWQPKGTTPETYQLATVVATVTKAGGEAVPYASLADALNAAREAAAGGWNTTSVTVEILSDITFGENDAWTPIVYNQSNPITINGNNHTITNLPGSLYAKSGSGTSSLTMNDLTFVNPKVTTVYENSAAVIMPYADSVEALTFKNVKIQGAVINTSANWTGAFVGFAAGYSNVNDGPLYQHITFDNCSVTESQITGNGSAGGLMGHASGSTDSRVVVTGTTVSGNTVTCAEEGKTNKAGALFGTVGNLGPVNKPDAGLFVDATVSGNTVTSSGTTITTIYGRQGSSNGTLTMNAGGSYDHPPIESNVAWAQPAEGCILPTTPNSQGVYSVIPGATIVFVNYDETAVLQAAADYAEGDAVAYSGNTPTRPADANGVYTFDGWTNAADTGATPTVYTAETLPNAGTTDITYVAHYTTATSVASVSHTENEVTTTSYYPTLQAAVNAAQDGDVITILANFTVDASLTRAEDRIVVDKALTIDFGAYTMSVPGSLEPSSNWAALFVDADLTVRGTTGGINCADNGSAVGVYAFNVRNGATLTIEGGNYHGGGTVVQAQLGTVVITGGTFTVTPFGDSYGSDFAFNCVDSAYTAGTAGFSISGGTFVGFDPQASNAEPGGPADFTAAGYVAIEDPTNPGTYGVVKGATITFVNADATVLATLRVAKDGAVAYSGTTPTKAADASYVYTWTGWTDGTNSYATTATLPAASTTNVTYTATYSTAASVASVSREVDGEMTVVGYYPSLAAAHTASQNGDTITLLDDITLPAIQTISKSLTVNLNGHTITSATGTLALTISGGTVTITGTGSITGDGEITIVASGASTSLTIDSNVTVTNTGTYGIYNAATVTIKGTVSGNWGVRNAGTLIVDDNALITGTTVVGIYNENSATVSTTVKGGKVVGNGRYGGIYANGGAVSVSGGEVTGTNVGIMLYGSPFLTVTGGKITATESGTAAIQTNGAQSGDTITISAGEIAGPSDGYGIYRPSDGTLSISGGTISGGTGVEVRAGVLNVTGGTITGGKGTPENRSNNDGATTSNAGIAIAQHTTKLPIDVNVSGNPTITAAAALYIVNPESNTETTNAITVDIEGTPTFDGTTVTDDARADLTVSGGLFDTEVRLEDCAEGYIPATTTNASNETVHTVVAGATITFVNYDGTTVLATNVPKNGAVAYSGATPTKAADANGVYTFDGWTNAADTGENPTVYTPAALPAATTTDVTYLAHFSTATSIASVTRNDSVIGYYATLADAVAAAEDGDTVTILANFTIPADNTEVANRIVVDKAVTIDFGAYTMTVPGSLEPTSNWAALYIDANTTVKATTGGINCADNGSDVGVYAFNVRSGATLTIESGNYHGGGTIAQAQLGHIVVEGGTFTLTPFEAPYGSNFAFNCVDSAYTAGTASISISGGTFVGFDPQDNAAEGEHTNFTAAHYVAIESETQGTFEVVQGATITFKNGDETLATLRVAKDGAVAYSGTTPTKAADANGVYTFDGWAATANGVKLDSLPAATTTDVTYYAHYTSVDSVASVTTAGGVITYYATLKEALDVANTLDGATVTLLKHATLNTGSSASARYAIKKSMTIEGGGHTITIDNRGFGVGMNASSNIDVTFRNVTILNSSNGARCIDTRGNIGTLTLDNTTLSTQGARGSTQPLTIGGNQSTKATVNILNDSVIKTNDEATAYYAIITFNPVNMKIDHSTISGWACIYAKGPDGSAGSGGSVFTITNSTLNSKNVSSGETNAFSMFMVEDNNVTINVTDTVMNVTATGDQHQAITSFQKGDNLSGVAVNLRSGNAVTMIGENAVFHDNEAPLVVSGGTFNVAVPAEVCAVGMIPETGENTVYDPNADTYTVVAGAKVTFKNGDTVLTTIGVPQGEAVAYSGANPTKAADASGVYSFDGWTVEGGDGTVYTAATLPAAGNVDVTYIAHYATATSVASVTHGTDVTYYATLAAAVAAASAGDTVTLLADDTVPAANTAAADRIVVSKPITIDFGGYTLSVPGSLEPTDNWAALYVDADLTVRGTIGGIKCLDKDNGECGVYAFNVGSGATLTIESGNYHGGGTIVQAALGKVVVKGGTFTATAFEAPYGMNFVFNCKDANYTAGTASISIEGGTFVGFDPQSNAAEGANTDFTAPGYVAIEDPSNPGTYGVVEGATITFKNGEDVLVELRVAKGGAVTKPADPTKAADANGVYTFDGWTVQGGGETVITTLPVAETTDITYVAHYSTATSVASVTHGGETTYYASLAEAIAAAQSGDTVTLLADVTLTATQEIAQNLTLDLNGHNITAVSVRALNIKSGEVSIVDNSTGTTKGTITSTHTDGDGLVSGSSVIRVGDVGEAKAKLTIGAGVTVDAPYTYGVTVFGTNTEGVELVVNGTINAHGTEAAISGNGNYKGAVTINAGAVVTSENSEAIYHPQGDTLTINGGTITGKTAVYVKSGTVAISDGTLSATGDKANYTFNGNDCVPTGDALVVDSCNYPGGAPTVTISGGTFTSTSGKGIGSYSDAGTTVGATDPGLASVHAESSEITIPDNEIWVANTYGSYDLVEAVVVTFELAGGKIGDSTETVSVKIAKGRGIPEVQRPQNPTLTNYVFDGWYVMTGETMAETKTDLAAATFSANTTLKAKWKGETVTVTVTSSGNGSASGGNSIAMVSGGGQYEFGSVATLRAPKVSGYTFVGWFKLSSDEPISTSQTCEYTINEFDLVDSVPTIKLIAVYSPASGARFRLTVSGSKFTVDDGTIQRSRFYEDYSANSTVSVEFQGPENFLYWINDSGIVVSTTPRYTFPMISNTTIQAVYSDAVQGTEALVVFLSKEGTDGQVLAQRYYANDEAINFPTAPTILGYRFTGWSMTEDQIHTAMETSTRVEVTPTYEQGGEAYRVTLEYWVRNDNGEGFRFYKTYDMGEHPLGNSYTIQSGAKAWGLQFSYLTDANGTILSFDRSIMLRPTADITIRAYFGADDVTVQPIAFVANAYRTENGNRHMVNFTIGRTVPETFTLVRAGVLYANKAAFGQDVTVEDLSRDLVVDSENAAVSLLWFNGTKATDSTNFYLTVSNDNTQYLVRGFVVVRDGEGSEQVIYSDNAVYASYSDLGPDGAGYEQFIELN